MMKLCEYCSNWAQWQLRWVEREPKEKTDTAEIPQSDGTVVKKKLVPRGPKYSDGPYLCGTHKLTMEEQIKQEPSDLGEGRFFFIGARPA
jgi:hypothetical protein